MRNLKPLVYRGLLIALTRIRIDWSGGFAQVHFDSDLWTFEASESLSSDKDSADDAPQTGGAGTAAGRRRTSSQIGLFGEDPAPKNGRARPEPPEVAEQALELTDLGRALPQKLRYGTSSWSFPGWRGLVWDQDHSQGLLSRHGPHILRADVGRIVCGLRQSGQR